MSKIYKIIVLILQKIKYKKVYFNNFIPLFLKKMLNFLLQAAATSNNFPFKSMLAKVFTSINKNLDICKVNNDAGGIIEIFGT